MFTLSLFFFLRIVLQLVMYTPKLDNNPVMKQEPKTLSLAYNLNKQNNNNSAYLLSEIEVNHENGGANTQLKMTEIFCGPTTVTICDPRSEAFTVTRVQHT